MDIGMFTVLLEHKLLSGIFLALLSLSIICQIIIGVIYRKLIKETDNMSTANLFSGDIHVRLAPFGRTVYSFVRSCRRRRGML